MIQYLKMLRDILNNGESHDDRTGVGTLSVFCKQARFDLRQGFPLLTTKRVGFRWIAEELLWFLSGDTWENHLRARGVDIWKEWADLEHTSRFGRAEGDLGPVYGWQWRRFGVPYPGSKSFPAYRLEAQQGIDQIANLLYDIKHTPNSRRLIITAWNPRDATEVDLPPCHTLFQFKVLPDAYLSCHLFMRSADVFLGVPFNIASYALLTHLIALVSGLEARELVVSYTDLHLYKNHTNQALLQLTRAPRELPQLLIKDSHLFFAGGLEALLAIRSEHLSVEGYNPHPKIEAPVAV